MQSGADCCGISTHTATPPCVLVIVFGGGIRGSVLVCLICSSISFGDNLQHAAESYWALLTKHKGNGGDNKPAALEPTNIPVIVQCAVNTQALRLGGVALPLVHGAGYVLLNFCCWALAGS